VDAELIKGGGGIFDVEVDGQLIYSKHQTGRFPEHSEILDQLRG
jgi:selenoprotein W-related protein